MKVTIGKAPLTSVRLQSGARFHVDKGAPVPGSADQKDLDRLVADGFLEVVEVETEEQAPAVSAPAQKEDLSALADEELVKRGVDKVLDTVGDDAERAARLLELESGKGGKARPKLIAGLQEAIDAKAASDSSGGDD